MWLICGKCKKHKNLYDFCKHIRNVQNFQLAYECKECTRKHADNNRGIYKKHYPVRLYQNKIAKNIKPIIYKNKNFGWDDEQILEFMGFRLSDLIDINCDPKNNDVISTRIEYSDFEKLNSIRELIKSNISNSSILRVALRYLFYKLKV